MDERKGYILLSRKITSSEIFNKPPLYLKVWVYLLSHAQYKDYKGLKKGQLWVSVDKIREDCSYFKGYVKVTPSKDEINKIIAYLRSADESDYESDAKATMIATTKATRGLVINIENYAYYQDPKNYESNDESDHESGAKELRRNSHTSTIKETDKALKKENNKNTNKEGCDGIASHSEKSSYGEFTNVKLTIEEYEKIKSSRLESYIAKLSSYKESTGKKYKSDYATILNWSRKDGEGKRVEPIPTYESTGSKMTTEEIEALKKRLKGLGDPK
jgi:hypothetical protein